MKKISNFIVKNINIITLIYIVAVSVLIVFFTRRGDDFHFHMMRLNAIANEYSINGIKAFPIRIYSTVLDGYGYGAPMFYGDIFMQPFAVLTLFGLSMINAYRLMMLCTFICTFLVTKFIAKKIYSQKVDAEIFVFMYMVSATIYGNATGSAIGRDFAQVFVPMVIGGMYLILYKEDRYDWLWLGIGMTGLMFSNVIDFAICAVSLLFIFIINIKTVDLNKLFKVIKAAIVCIGLTLWFLAPMLEQMSSQTFFVTSDTVNQDMNDLSRYTVPLIGLILPQKAAYLLEVIIGKSINLPVAYMNGFLVLIVIAVLAVIYIKNIANNKFILSALVLICFFIWFQTKLFPFNALKKLLGVIQFPYRVNIVMTVLGAIITVSIYKITKKNSIIAVLMCMQVWFIVITILSTTGVSIYEVLTKNESFSDYSYTINDIMGAEYLPEKLLVDKNKHTYKEFLQQRKNSVICSNSDTITNFERNCEEYILSFKNNKGLSKFEMPLLMYKGYSARYSETNESISVESSNNGLVQIETNKTDGNIVIKYTGTIIQRISNIISLIFSIMLLVYLVVDRKRVKIKK